MDEEEHEVYGGDIPVEGDLEGDLDAANADVDMSTGDDDAAVKELDEMKKRLKEMEEEAAALREMQAKVEKEMGSAQDPATAAELANKEEVDARSVFVGNVDYACTPEEVQQHFQSCGTVNRVTILTDKFGQPKGFAYVEFVEQDGVQQALQLNESELHGRQLKELSTRHTLSLAFQTLGVVYGDVGTSPLYVFTDVFSKVPITSEVDILVALSVIMYTIALVSLAKYVFVVLKANDNGEGT
uniref:RRM domain-containing protein n=1 Tax=Chenopodium quinoa TaxID=63459 RepID=A0A803KSH6_CHEQI